VRLLGTVGVSKRYKTKGYEIKKRNSVACAIKADEMAAKFRYDQFSASPIRLEHSVYAWL
jgi:hypothetical protein